ncbi:MAG: hypothetical protein HY072_01890 [Deltaproteobacteria bacterium]|nr:hypothetical protein [Deltaproteobacteria bacterium]
MKNQKSGDLPENKFKNLFRDLNVSVSIQRYPNELIAGLQLSLVDAFKRSPWFHSQGRSVLLAKTSGEHQYDQQKIAIQLVHEYYVDERYVSYEDVRKTRQVPYDTYESHYNYINKTYEERRVTKYRNEEYWIKEPVERTRRITKYFPYGAWKISQVLGLTLSGESLVESKDIRWNLNDRVTQEDTMSEIRMTDIGLSPKEPKKISNREDWLKDKTSQFAKEFEDTLGKAWEEAYCVEDSNSKNFNYIGNRVRKCLRKEFATPPTFVKDWYIKNFGLEVQEVTKLLQAVR